MNRLPYQQAGTLLYVALTLAAVAVIASIVMTLAAWQIDTITNRTTYDIQKRLR